MAALYHTNGTATLAANGLTLGLSSADGVRISINEALEEIYSDQNGPALPSEVLINGPTASIEFELWKYDSTVLQSILALRMGSGTLGVAGTVGKLMFYNSLTFALSVASPVDGLPWYFPRCWIQDEASVQLSTQLKIYSLKIRAVPNDAGTLFTGGG